MHDEWFTRSIWNDFHLHFIYIFFLFEGFFLKRLVHEVIWKTIFENTFWRDVINVVWLFGYFSSFGWSSNFFFMSSVIEWFSAIQPWTYMVSNFYNEKINFFFASLAVNLVFLVIFFFHSKHFTEKTLHRILRSVISELQFRQWCTSSFPERKKIRMKKKINSAAVFVYKCYD